MKRMFGIGLIVLVVASIAAADWNFDRDGGTFDMKLPVVRLQSPEDTVIQTDTVLITNAQNDTIKLDFGEFAEFPSAWGRIVFIVGDNADSERYFTADLADTVADTIDLTADLSVATSANDSAIIYWYSDNNAVDTVTAPVTPYKITALAHIVLTARLTAITHSDSCGIKILFRNRLGDNGAWSTIWTAYLDTVEEFDTIIVGDSIQGDQWQTLIVVEDSLGGTANRSLRAAPEAFIRGRKY